MLGVSGSIAAYKSADIVRRLVDLGASVRVVMTKNATKFISPLTLGTLSRGPVLIDEFQTGHGQGIGHIDATESLDLALIAPATANIIGKISAGIGDDALTASVLAIDCPLLIAPAMNERMFMNPVVQRNLRLLIESGVRILEPETGALACGGRGHGRLASIDRIVEAVEGALAPKDLTGMKVVVTAGPTREPIDAVRFISNPSSGRMGYALASAARDRGAEVVLISGPTHLRPPAGVRLRQIKTAREMLHAVTEEAGSAKAVIMAAAVSDFRPRASSGRKIKKESADIMLELERTEDILLELGKNKAGRVLVGFAAETDSVMENARRKMEQKGLDLIVANNILDIGAGFEVDTNKVTIIESRGGIEELPVMPKSEVARRIIHKTAELLRMQGILP